MRLQVRKAGVDKLPLAIQDAASCPRQALDLVLHQEGSGSDGFLFMPLEARLLPSHCVPWTPPCCGHFRNKAEAELSLLCSVPIGKAQAGFFSDSTHHASHPLLGTWPSIAVPGLATGDPGDRI